MGRGFLQREFFHLWSVENTPGSMPRTLDSINGSRDNTRAIGMWSDIGYTPTTCDVLDSPHRRG